MTSIVLQYINKMRGVYVYNLLPQIIIYNHIRFRKFQSSYCLSCLTSRLICANRPIWWLLAIFNVYSQTHLIARSSRCSSLLTKQYVFEINQRNLFSFVKLLVDQFLLDATSKLHPIYQNWLYDGLINQSLRSNVKLGNIFY